MRNGHQVGVIIPALNEELAIGSVVRALPHWVDVIIVADNGSSDGTAAVAADAGAIVVGEQRRGYGAACMAALGKLPPVDIVVFVDGDYSDYPEDIADLVDPIVDDGHELVIGSRTLGGAEAGALTVQQRFGNSIATLLIRLFWGVKYSDLGPFRAIRRDALEHLAMNDQNFGWTVEMQVKAAEQGLRVFEVPVRYRRRVGVSKISGTVRGTVLAGSKILSIIVARAVRGMIWRAH